MHHLMLAAEAATHQTYAALLALADRVRSERPDDDHLDRDRGAVSLEQVLWFVAAGVSVTVIAAILWGTIRDQAEDPANIDRPAQP